MPTTPVLAFRLKVPGIDEVRGLRALSTTFKFSGFLSLEGELVTLEWSGTAQVQDVSPMDVRDEKLTLPTEQLTLPAQTLYRASLAGGWWRPRIVLQARELDALAIVPGEDHGTLELWYARREGGVAKQMVDALTAAIAQPALPGSRPRVQPSSDQFATTPPEGSR